MCGLQDGTSVSDLKTSDLEGSFTGQATGLFKWNPSNICAAFYQVLTERVLARSPQRQLSFLYLLLLTVTAYCQVDQLNAYYVKQSGCYRQLIRSEYLEQPYDTRKANYVMSYVMICVDAVDGK